MEKRFEFNLDPSRSLMEFKLWGFWEDIEELEAFEEEFKKKVREISKNGTKEWVAIVNLSDFPPQPKEIQEGHKKTMKFAKENKMKRAAHVMGSAVTNMQLQRLADSVDKSKWRYFRTKQECLDWLFE